MTIGVAAILWIGVPVIAGREGLQKLLDQPSWLTILLLPLVAAGLNLIAYRDSHEEICRLEVARHPWLPYLVGRGYSARTFAWTGIALLGLVVVIVAARLGGTF